MRRAGELRNMKDSMGEVRVKVKLANGVDQALVRRRLLAADQVRTYETDALVDTGAVRSVLPVEVLQRLSWKSCEQPGSCTEMTRQKMS
jgi:predicted aspartyl protease